MPKSVQTIKGLDGCYIKVGHTGIRLVLKDGSYQWGSRDIHDSGTYAAEQPDDYSCLVEFSSELLKSWRRQCLFTRHGKTYTVKELPNGEVNKFKRDDGTLFLAELPSGGSIKQTPKKQFFQKENWKSIGPANATVSYQLTGESVIRAATIPAPPSSKKPAIVRVSHLNCYGPVDSDIFVRLGNPKKPLGVKDFNTVSDWRKAELVEDLTEREDDEWKLRESTDVRSAYWCGTYQVEIQFPKGYHQIELKIISRVKQVCSIVLSNWKVHVR